MQQCIATHDSTIGAQGASRQTLVRKLMHADTTAVPVGIPSLANLCSVGGLFAAWLQEEDFEVRGHLGKGRLRNSVRPPAS